MVNAVSEISLFDWATARENAKTAAQKEWEDANNALALAETELYEANTSSNMHRMTRASNLFYATSARFDSAKKALRQFN